MVRLVAGAGLPGRAQGCGTDKPSRCGAAAFGRAITRLPSILRRIVKFDADQIRALAFKQPCGMMITLK
jgi:hypothetical protein